ncbi:PREDICTED: uncharacterized protein LOC102183566 isoform X3 [Capra hircus]|uniref:uncharacterized protein LOC102183566 isoform X3 n=1 Tax=Capra hircus TaxID=9925 RepID=UPI000846A36C|nr:PREDICTED: uncharacterized protein LOC102183566 isoform X3 [Capra hircus]
MECVDLIEKHASGSQSPVHAPLLSFLASDVPQKGARGWGVAAGGRSHPACGRRGARVKAEQILRNRRSRSLVFSSSALPSDSGGTRKAAPLPVTKKRACRRLDAAAPERDCPQVRVRIPASGGSEEPESLDAQRRGRLPSPRPDSGQRRPGMGGPPDGGRSRAQPCPRCIAGESVLSCGRFEVQVLFLTCPCVELLPVLFVLPPVCLQTNPIQAAWGGMTRHLSRFCMKGHFNHTEGR